MTVNSAQTVSRMNDLPAFVDLPLISASYAEHLLDVLEARGCSRAELFAAWGKAPDVLTYENARLTPRDFMSLIEYARNAGKNEGLGYALGMEIKPTSHGFLGMALMSCTTAREALQLGQRFIPLRSGLLQFRFIDEGETGIIQFDNTATLGSYRQFLLEVMTSVVVRTAAFLLGRNSATTEIWLDYPEPDYFAEWREKLPRVRFSMPASQIRFPSAVLDKPLVLSSPAMTRTAVVHLEAELAIMEPAVGMASRTRVVLERSQGNFPSLENVASQLCVSASTLKRRLQQEGSTFQALLDEVRCARAIRYLDNTPMNVEQVAQALGYVDPANFSRAFRKWTGRSPSAWRQDRKATT